MNCLLVLKVIVSLYIGMPGKNLFNVDSWKNNAKLCLYKYMAWKDFYLFTFKFNQVRVAK